MEMKYATEIDFTDANKAGDPDKDGLPGITIVTKEAQSRINARAKKLYETPIASPEWYDVLYLLVLEYGVNLKYLNPVFAKMPGAIIISSGLILLIKYWAKRIGVKVKDLKNPENL